MTKKGLYFCGAGVTSSPHRNLVATAADCLNGDPADKLAFAPQVLKSAAGTLEAPKGVYAVKRQGNRSLVWTGSDSGGAASSAAVGFAMVDKGIKGDQLEDTVPGHRLLTDAGHTHKGARVAGHSATKTQPAAPCIGDTSEASVAGAPTPFLRLDCGPASAGIAAGAVFIADYDAKTRVGNLIGVSQRIAAAESPSAAHSTYFGTTVQALYDEAVSGSKPTVTPPITPPGASPSQPAPRAKPSGAPSPSPSPAKPSDPVAREDDGLKATPAQIEAAKEAEAYWTPERIARATPKSAKQSAPGIARENDVAAVAPSHFDNNGIATVGVFLINEDDDPQSDPGGRDQFCSASSVASPTKSIVLTAAHCLNDNDRWKRLAFAPGWKPDPSNSSRGVAPYGIFPMVAGKLYIDGRYLTQGPSKADDLDFAFMRVGPNSKGQFLENATGMGNSLTTLSSQQLSQKNVSLFGFPGGSKAPLVCPSANTTGFSGRFLKIACKGYAGGVSGGPFLRNFDGKRGDVIGVIGGWKTGGTIDDESYSSQFDADVIRLYNQAVNDYEPDKPTGGTMGTGDLWKHATGGVSGTFHTSSQEFSDSDLIVKWDDGEVTLYPGDQNFGFYAGCKPNEPCETQLAGPNAMWKNYADVITAGDYAGTNASDLMVKWVDGEVTIYPDVSQNTKLPTALDQHLPNEIHLAAADSVFKYARGFATGKYGGNQWPDDLIVRWSDGELTKYTDIDGDGLHAEEQLAAPNDLWQTASLMTGGDLDGDSNGTTPNHDLLVVWATGKVSVFPDVNTGRLQNESIVASGSTWAHARVIALGEYGMNDWEDDLFVRWSDGEVTVYGNTQADAVGREYQLVPPAAAGFAAVTNGALRPNDPCANVCGPELYRRSH
ncbi:trypsin-like serine peptidase [Streptomyces erythrochromogenes]|uniref:trypsin-like serine peptidase n=1 Tax=Streptomyces erythrochromogenes TaxID=285574 RepID=UPI0037F1A14E